MRMVQFQKTIWLLSSIHFMLAESFHELPWRQTRFLVPSAKHSLRHTSKRPLPHSYLLGTSKRYKSAIPTQERDQPRRVEDNRSLLIPDWVTLSLHTLSCLCMAVLLCGYEDFDCSHLKPNVTGLRPQAIMGLGQGRASRLEYNDILVTPTDISLKQMRSYNEIMLEHRLERIPHWQPDVTEVTLREGVQSIYSAMDATQQLKILAQDYDWEGMRALIQDPVLSSDLEQAATILRGATVLLSAEARHDVGFDWGSCAWRHCGAEADAQEALAELNNLSGVLEPFECEFIIDIVDRSLRDMIAMIPPIYLQPERVTLYQPYESKNIMDETNEESSIDQDYLHALDDLRKDLLEEGTD